MKGEPKKPGKNVCLLSTSFATILWTNLKGGKTVRDAPDRAESSAHPAPSAWLACLVMDIRIFFSAPEWGDGDRHLDRDPKARAETDRATARTRPPANNWPGVRLLNITGRTKKSFGRPFFFALIFCFFTLFF